MLTGFKGVKYGLTVPKKEGKAVPKKSLAAFADDDSDDDGQKIARDIERQAQRKQSDKKVAKMQAAALAEDPSIFDYDAHFDSIQEQREGPKAAERQERKSRYIEGLLDKAKERQKEQDIVYERRLLHERQAEDHLFGDKERFVTAAYKRKLEEDKKWLEEERMKEKLEAEQDVRKRGHMGDFYRNLLTNNVAFGTAKSQQKAAPNAAQAAAGDEAGGSGVGEDKWEELRRAREAYEARVAKQSGGEASERAAPDDTRAPAGEAPKSAAPGDGKAATGDAKASNAAEEASQRDEVEAEPAEEAPPPISREDKAAAARARFLARKRKAPGA